MLTEVQTKIETILNNITAQKDGIPGVVFAAVDRHGTPLVNAASGVRQAGETQPMTTDTVFWIASLTKTVTGIAAMQMVEKGELSLDDADQIAQHLPEVANAKILSRSNGSFKETTAKNRITLRMLLTHTSGFSYTFFNEDIRDFMTDGDEFAGTLAGVTQPLIVEPGTVFRYGVGIDWAGVLVERVSGLTLGDYCDKHIFAPVGAMDTAFEVRDHMRARLAGMHARNSEGVLVKHDHFGIAYAKKNAFHSGGGGLFSTATDYLKILVPLMNKGLAADGKTRILEATTVAEMLEDNIDGKGGHGLEDPIAAARPALTVPLPNVLPGLDVRKGWGLTFLVDKDPMPWGRSRGSVQWAGLANLFWWCDPPKGVAGVIMSQILPFGDAKVAETWVATETELYKANLSS